MSSTTLNSGSMPAPKFKKLQMPQPPHPYSWSQLVDSLDPDLLRWSLCLVAERSLVIAKIVLKAHDVQAARQKAKFQQKQCKVIDFDHYNEDIWDRINSSWESKLSCSKQYEAACGVFEDCVSLIEKLVQEASGSYVSYESKKGALETLCKIGGTMLCDDRNSTLGDEIRKEFQMDATVPNGTLSIIRSMTAEEIDRLAKSRFDHEVDSLVSALNGYGIEGDNY